MSTNLEHTPLSLGDLWKRYWYLGWVDTWLWTMPRRRRKAVLAELKQNLSVAASEYGMPAAIEELGAPKALAAQYLEEEPVQGPIWAHGIMAAIIAGAVWIYAMMIYVFGMLDALLSAEVHEATHINFLGVNILAEASDETLGATFSGFSWPALIFIAVAFALFSRVWRVARRNFTTST